MAPHPLRKWAPALVAGIPPVTISLFLPKRKRSSRVVTSPGPRWSIGMDGVKVGWGSEPSTQPRCRGAHIAAHASQLLRLRRDTKHGAPGFSAREVSPSASPHERPIRVDKRQTVHVNSPPLVGRRPAPRRKRADTSELATRVPKNICVGAKPTPIRRDEAWATQVGRAPWELLSSSRRARRDALPLWAKQLSPRTPTSGRSRGDRSGGTCRSGQLSVSVRHCHPCAAPLPALAATFLSDAAGPSLPS